MNKKYFSAPMCRIIEVRDDVIATSPVPQQHQLPGYTMHNGDLLSEDDWQDNWDNWTE